MKKNALFFLLFFANLIIAQKNIENQNLLWTRYVTQLEFSKKWTIVAEVDERIFIKPIQQNVWLSRIQGRYRASQRIELGTGFTYLSVSTKNPEVDPGYQTPEYRIHQDLTIRQPFGKLVFIQRFQFEQRFIDENSKENEFYLRYRYRIQADYNFWETKKKFLKAILSDEVMLNGGSNVENNTFDQNRFYAALQYVFNKNLSVELGYLNSYQQRASGVDFYNRNIIRLSVFQKIKI